MDKSERDKAGEVWTHSLSFDEKYKIFYGIIKPSNPDYPLGPQAYWTQFRTKTQSRIAKELVKKSKLTFL